MNGEGQEKASSREATLDAVHSDQLGLSEQLRTLSEMLTKIEEHLLGGEHMKMLSVAAAQSKATLGAEGLMPGQAVMPAPTLDAPTHKGLLLQMCDLGTNNAQSVLDMQRRLSSISRLLSVPMPKE